MSEWISVDERLPERNNLVSVYNSQCKEIGDGFRGWDVLLTDVVWYVVQPPCFRESDCITHWQPKTYPKPPEVEPKHRQCHTCEFWLGKENECRGKCSRVAEGCVVVGCGEGCDDWEGKEPKERTPAETLGDFMVRILTEAQNK